MNLKIKNEIEEKIGKKVTELKYNKCGGANIVYEVGTDNNERYIFKLYKMKRDMSNNNKLNNYLKNKGITTLNLIAQGKIAGNPYHIYTKNEGGHKRKYTEEMANKILEVIGYEYNDKNKLKLNSYNNSIIQKYLIYRKYFQKNDTKKIPQEVISDVNKIAENVKLEFKDMYLIHGDLSITNILWKSKNFSIIDFDESIYAPIEYELSSFIVKSCFVNGHFNKKIAKIIMKNLKLKFRKLNYDSLRNSWILFLLKVIYEKFYYYELGYTDIESAENKKDYWVWWYKLLKNQKIFDELYFDDLVLSTIKDNKMLIKSSEKSKVEVVTLDNDSFILKRRKKSKEENTKVEQELLEQLSINLNVPRILKYETCKGYVYKLYTLMQGKQKINCEKEEDTKLIDEFFKLMQTLDKIDLKVQKGNIKIKIKKMLYETDNEIYKNCLNRLLSDSEFMKRIRSEEKQIIHDDLNACNILFSDNNMISFIDFEGVKIYPKSLQIASFITNRYIYEGDIKQIDIVLSKLNLNLNRKYIIKLIVYRTIKTLIFFEKEEKMGNKEFTKKRETLYNSLIEIIDDLKV